MSLTNPDALGEGESRELDIKVRLAFRVLLALDSQQTMS
eukprot:SAG31_NODE_511_length_14722_cov_14.770499_6_plen_39_part_00